MTAQPRTWAEYAAVENAAARRTWGVQRDGRRSAGKNIAGQITPYLGSGLSKSEVARRLGCSVRSVSKALVKVGGSL